MSNPRPKQMIVMRKDLNMRKGKMVAQGAHASLKAILDLGSVYRVESDLTGEVIKIGFSATLQQERFIWNGKPDINHPAVIEWLEGLFAKICVSVNSEQELLDIIQKAKDAGLITSLITDAGLTEFNGVATITCGAVGPAYPEQLDPITGHLPLL
jgi:PTH2 family peptidyl-tRNA hydrolase